MTNEPENWLREQGAAADKQLREGSFAAEINIADSVMASVEQLARPIVVSDNASWVAGGLVSLATAWSVFLLLPSRFSLTDPWMSFWLF